MKKSNKKILTVIICTIIMFNFCGILNKYSYAETKTNNNTTNNQSNNSSNSSNNSNQDLSMPGVAAGINNDMLMQAIAKAKNQGGDFNSIVSNPFIFCSGPKPKKGNPLRVVYDMICGDSQKNGQSASNSNSALTPTNPTPKVPGVSK